MSKTVRFAISLDNSLLVDFDNLIKRQGYQSRSEAIRDLIRGQLVTHGWEEKEEAIGTIMIVYDHHRTNLSDNLTKKQHEHHDLIVSSMHVHLNNDNCLEIIAVKGEGKKNPQPGRFVDQHQRGKTWRINTDYFRERNKLIE